MQFYLLFSYIFLHCQLCEVPVMVKGPGPPQIATEYLKVSTGPSNFPAYSFHPVRWAYNTAQPQVGLDASC